MFSYWEQQIFLSGIDVAVIGSGIVGLSAAISLKQRQPGLRVAVFERGMLPSGASTKNAGFACFGSISELLMNLEEQPEDVVFGLVEKRFRGLQKLRQNIGDDALRYEDLGGYELFHDETFYQQCADRMTYLNRQLGGIIGPDVYRSADQRIADFGFKQTSHLILNAYEGQLHTGRMMQALIEKARSSGILLYNGACIDRLEPAGSGIDLYLREGRVTVRRVLVATNGFARQLLPDLDVTPARGQVLVTVPIPDLRIRGAFHLDRGYVYFRNIDNRILLGGGRHLDISGEATTEPGLTPTIQQYLENLLRTVILPDREAPIETRWSGTMGFGRQQEPIVRHLGGGVFCAVKMQGMGVALGSLTGEEAAERMAESL